MSSFDNEDIQTLVKLGLNSSQAKVYLTLISLGAATAKKIAQTAGIDRGETYRQLSALQGNSLIETIVGVPTKYAPIPLNVVIKTLIEKRNKESADLQEKTDSLLLRRIGLIEPEEEPEENSKISIIPPESPIRQYIKQMCERTQKEILWYTQIERIPLTLAFYYQSHEKMAKKGIREFVLAELNKPTDTAVQFIQKYKKEHPNFEIRFVNPTTLITFAISDSKEMDIFTKAAKGLADSPALYTNNIQLIRVFKDYFELKWKSGMTEYPAKNDANH